MDKRYAEVINKVTEDYGSLGAGKGVSYYYDNNNEVIRYGYGNDRVHYIYHEWYEVESEEDEDMSFSGMLEPKMGYTRHTKIVESDSLEGLLKKVK